MFPLIFYLLLRWRYIEKNCRKIGHPAYFLETDCLNFNSYGGVSIKDSAVQTATFLPEIVTVYKNVPYLCNNNNYLKDTGCQTDTCDLIERGIQHVNIDDDSTSNSNRKRVEENLFTNGETYETFKTTKPLTESSPVDKDKKIIERHQIDDTLSKRLSVQSEETEKIKFRKPSAVVAEKRRHTVTSAGFKSPRDSDVQKRIQKIDNGTFRFHDDKYSRDKWSDVVRETKETVKKVEEYIYDDYETFKKEDYNQISSAKNSSSVFDKISKIGWTYTPKDSSRLTLPDDSHKRPDESFFHQSYFRFEDVFNVDGSFKTNDDESGLESLSSKTDCPKETTSLQPKEVQDESKVFFRHSYFKFEDVCEKDMSHQTTERQTILESPSCKNDNLDQTVKNNYSRIPLCDKTKSNKEENKSDDEPKTKKTFSLKRFKLNLDFLRIMTPKKTVRHTPSHDTVRSRVKYKKIKNVKSTTF